jgi:hypothetical protein
MGAGVAETAAGAPAAPPGLTDGPNGVDFLTLLPLELITMMIIMIGLVEDHIWKGSGFF